MKTFKEFIKEAPTMSVGNGGYTNAAANTPTGGFDKRLFPVNDDLLDQGFQTAAETGLAKWATYSNVYPVMKVTLDNNKGDGPSVDSMVAASNEYVNIMDRNVADRIRKTFSRFMGNRN